MVGLLVCLIRRLQSVRNATLRLIFRLRRSDHVSDALAGIHWLRVPERITYKNGVLICQALCDVAPRYFRQFVRSADKPYRRSLRSATTDCLIFPAVKLSFIGCCSFRDAMEQSANGNSFFKSLSCLRTFKNLFAKTSHLDVDF
jgi:hypothetical protein